MPVAARHTLPEDLPALDSLISELACGEDASQLLWVSRLPGMCFLRAALASRREHGVMAPLTPPCCVRSETAVLCITVVDTDKDEAVGFLCL
jgi:hypothetical protein